MAPARSSGRLKVELVSHASHVPGGAVYSLMEMALGLRDRPDIDLCVVLPSPGPLGERLRSAGIAVTHRRHLRWVVARGARGRELRAAPGLLAGAVRGLRASAPDVVLTNTLVQPGPAIAARIAGIPHVWRIGELPDREHPLPLVLPSSLTVRLIGRLSAAVIVPSRAVARQLAGHVPGDRLHVVPAAADLVAPLRRPARRLLPLRRLVAIGRLTPVKRLGDAAGALRHLVARGHDIRLSVIGPLSGPLRAAFESRVRAEGLPARVDLLGPLPSPWEAIEDDAVLVSCSGDEGFARVVVEAMRRSVPVVAADGGAHREAILHGRTGLLYRTGDPAALADRVHRLTVDRRLRSRIIRNAYEAVSEGRTGEATAAAVAGILWGAARS